MILTAASNQTNFSTNSQTTYESMLSTEDFYKQSEHKASTNGNNITKNENIYNFNNNNSNSPLLTQEVPYMDKLNANGLLDESFRPLHMNGETTQPLLHNGTNSIDEQRALQLTLELSMLGLTNDDEANFNDIRGVKKSMNMTECVPVPSSEHVAEIVGRQGLFTFSVYLTFVLASVGSCLYVVGTSNYYISQWVGHV